MKYFLKGDAFIPPLVYIGFQESMEGVVGMKYKVVRLYITISEVH